MMPSICGTMIGELGLPSLVDHHGCVLPMGHDGPHQCVDTRWQAWQWEEDLECACEHCRQCEGFNRWPKIYPNVFKYILYEEIHECR